eukprot:1430986-Rhodomonas_salina.2
MAKRVADAMLYDARPMALRCEITCSMSRAACHVQHVTCSTSRAACHVQHVTCSTSRAAWCTKRKA